MFPPRRHQGVALITVLLIVAILVGLTTQLLSNHHLVISRHQNSFEHDQALQYALGAEELVRQVLYDDFINTGPGVDHREEPWAMALLPFEIDQMGYLEARVRDLNDCFNVNLLANAEPAKELERLKRLLQLLNLDVALADLIKDWIDDDQQVSGFGAEDNVYLERTPGYRTANAPMGDLSELMLLADISQEAFAQLAPHLCALPTSQNRMNVNTASALALAMLDPNIDEDSASSLVAEHRNYQSTEEFIQVYPDFAAVLDQLQVTSDYFLMHVRVQLGDSRLSLASLFFRDPSTGFVTLLQRDFGKLFQTTLQIQADLQES